MARYIDANKLIWQVQDSDKYGTITKQVFISLLQNSETADVAPVVHAHWIYKGIDDNDNGDWECSHCGCGETHSVSCEVPYCWKCGAKMDEVET